MPCHNDGSPCGTSFFNATQRNPSHCDTRRPNNSNAVTLADVAIYPPIQQPSGLENPPADAVMYDSIMYTPYPPSYRGGFSYTSPTGATDTEGGECGKVTDLQTCGKIVYEYVPGELSFQDMDSDTWFGYLYDMGANGGAVGTPCFRLERETRNGTTTTSTPSSGVPGDPGYNPGSSSSTSDGEASKTRCIPCTNFYCTPVRSYASYTYNGPDETGDPDCPYPTIHTIGTESNKIAFRYNSLSTEIPDAVQDISFVYTPDNIDQDVWDQTNYAPGDPIVTTQNPWKAGDETFEDFVVVDDETLEDGDKVGLAVKFRISPVIDGTGETVVFTGTTWEFLELINGGQNYDVNDTFTLSYTRDHQDGTSSTLNMTLKITSVGPSTSVSAQEDFATLSEGDTINGHTVIATRHSDLDNFPYHIVYLDGSGSNFSKDTQYTSSRNHVITVVAGYGIVDRVYFGGLYEFFDKSVQYTVHSIDNNSPDVFNTIRQPNVTVNLSNGTVSGVTINDGGAGFNTLPEDPELIVTDPNVGSGRAARVEGVFSGGVLTSVNILDPGSGYTTTNPPQVWVKNVYRKDDTVTFEGISQEDAAVDTFLDRVRDEGTFPEFTEINASNPGAVAGNESRRQQYEQKTEGILQPNRSVKQDFNRRRTIELPQRRYRGDEVNRLRDTYDNFNNHDLPNANNITEQFRSGHRLSQDSNNQTLNTSLDNIIQSQVPDSISYNENYVETTQRRFADLPQASPLTKYTIKQYRADPATKTTLNITIGCDVQESGCAHIEPGCPGPGQTPDSETTTSSTDDDGNTTEYTVTFSYLLSPMLGPGCQNWSASGSMTVRHHLTRSTQTYAAASDAYGNPFDV